MQNIERWQPSKLLFDRASGRRVANPAYVALGSLPLVNVLAESYERVIREHARGRLLDCGCGDVPYYDLYRESTSEVTCIDWQATLHGKQHLDREVDLNGPLPFAPGAFDSVLLADVLEHIAQPAGLVSELARVLASGGKLIVTVPFLYRVHEEPHDYFRYTRFGLEQLAKRAGLEPVEVTPFGGYPDVLLDLIAKGLASVRPLCKLFLACVMWTTRTRPYRRWRARTQERFPLGYCAVFRKP